MPPLLFAGLALAAAPAPPNLDGEAAPAAVVATTDGDPLVMMPALRDRRWTQARGLRTAGVTCAIAGPVAIGAGLLVFVGGALGGRGDVDGLAALTLGIGGAGCVVAAPGLLIGAGLTARPIAQRNSRGRVPGMALRAVSGTLLAAGATFAMFDLPEPAAASWVGSVGAGWWSANQTLGSARRARFEFGLAPSLDVGATGARVVVSGAW